MERRCQTLAVLLGVFASAGAGSASPREAPALPLPSVEVREANGLYTVRGRFTVAATLQQTWEVLTDYGDLSRFVSSMRRSEILGLRDRGILVAQTMVARAFIFERPFHVVLDVHEVPWRTIAFRDVLHSDFTLYEGDWDLAKAPGGVAVTYRLQTRPRSRPPLFKGVGTFRATVTSLLTEVRSEILRRSRRARGGAQPKGGTR